MDARRAGLALAVWGGALAMWPGAPVVYALPKLLALSLGAAVAWRGARGRARTELDWPLCAALACAALSTAAGADPLHSLFGDYLQPYYGLLELALYACLFWLGAAASSEEAAFGVRAWALAAGAMGAVAAAQAAGLAPAPWDLMAGRALSTTGNPAYAGALFAIALPLCAHEALRRRGAASAAAVVLAAAGLTLTFSRAAWLGAAAAGALYATLSGRAATPRRRAALAALCAAGIAAGAATWWWRQHREAGARGTGANGSDVVRAEVWRCARAAVLDRPWLGWGPDAFPLAMRRRRTLALVRATHWTEASDASAHNDLLQAWVTGGALGLASYLALLAALALALWRRRAEGDRDRWAAGVAALGAAAVCAKVNALPDEALALCAWLAGALLARPKAPAADKRLVAWASAALAAAFALALGADRFRGQADAARVRGDFAAARGAADLASTLAPWQLEYAIKRAEIAFDQGRLRDGLEAAREAALRHDGNAQAHELYGSALLLASASDARLLPAAASELDRALGLDPTDSYTLERRAEAARRMGDAPAQARASDELRRVQDAAQGR